jgi:hypothetical protein
MTIGCFPLEDEEGEEEDEEGGENGCVNGYCF